MMLLTMIYCSILLQLCAISLMAWMMHYVAIKKYANVGWFLYMFTSKFMSKHANRIMVFMDLEEGDICEHIKNCSCWWFCGNFWCKQRSLRPSFISMWIYVLMLFIVEITEFSCLCYSWSKKLCKLVFIWFWDYVNLRRLFVNCWSYALIWHTWLLVRNVDIQAIQAKAHGWLRRR